MAAAAPVAKAPVGVGDRRRSPFVRESFGPPLKKKNVKFSSHRSSCRKKVTHKKNSEKKLGKTYANAGSNDSDVGDKASVGVGCGGGGAGL